MRLLLIAATAALVALPGCARLANSPINPLTWFGRSTEVVGGSAAPTALRPLVRQDQFVTLVDGRVPIETIDALEIERTASGAVIRATGTAAGQGYHNAELVPIATGGGTVVYEFRVEAPADPFAPGAPATRRITAASTLEPSQLAGIGTVRVQGRTNARETRR